MIRQQRRPTPQNERRGTTTVEFALVAPIILLLFFGAVEMTNLNMIRHTAANAAYEGARKMIVVGGTEEDARTEVLRLLGIVGIANGAEVDVDQWPDRIRVAVNVPVNLNSWGLGRFTGGTTVTQSCTLRRELVDHSLIVID
jgi:hypothetical protein